MALAVMDSCADVYREFQQVSFEFDQYMKKSGRGWYDPAKIRLPTEIFRVYNRGNM